MSPILLPTLLRAANDLDTLGYCVAPGIANTDPSDFGQLVTYAGSTVFLVDGDSDGKRYENLLLNAGVGASRVLNLSSISGIGDLNVEELVEPSHYVACVNSAVESHHSSFKPLMVEDLPPVRWAHYVATVWCPANAIGPPSKRSIAQRIVDEARNGGMDVVNPAGLETLHRIHEIAVAAFPPDRN